MCDLDTASLASRCWLILHISKNLINTYLVPRIWGASERKIEFPGLKKLKLHLREAGSGHINNKTTLDLGKCFGDA